MSDFVPGQSYADNNKQAARDAQRDPRLTRGRGLRADEATFATGTVACAACGSEVDAGSTTLTGDGALCEVCHADAEIDAVARRQAARPLTMAGWAALAGTVVTIASARTAVGPPVTAPALLGAVTVVVVLGLLGAWAVGTWRRGLPWAGRSLGWAVAAVLVAGIGLAVGLVAGG